MAFDSRPLIIFDCDGVLVDSELIAARVLAAHFSAHGYPVTATECLNRFLGATIAGALGQVRAEGVDLPADFEETLRVRERAAFDQTLKPVPGIDRAIGHSHVGRRCVASSGPFGKIEANLKLTGLYRFFAPYIFSAQMVHRPKPAPDLFFFAARAMNVSPERCVVIEDSPKGVEAARRAGMRVFGFTGAGHTSPAITAALRTAGADRLFDDMTRLPALLDPG